MAQHVLTAFVFVAALAAAQPATSAPADSAVDDLSIVTATGPHHFAVEVMRTREQLERGLMYRRQMAADRGMLFDFGAVQSVTMWMRNTYLPLDMVFIAADGRVVRDDDPLGRRRAGRAGGECRHRGPHRPRAG